eukprot:gene30117-39312_t
MSVSAEIQKFEIGRSGRVEYFIKVVFHGRVWAIRKRFSDFVILDRALRRQIQTNSHNIPVLPPKEWLGIQSWKKNNSKLVKRQRELQKYLHVLLNDVISNDNSLVKEFLEVDYNNLEITKRLSMMEVSKIDSHRRIVDTFLKQVIPIPISFKYMLSPKRHQFKNPFLGSGKGKFNRSRSATSISSGCGSLSTPSARISKDSQIPQPEASISFDLPPAINGVTTLSSLKSPSNSAKLIAQESNSATKDIFFENLKQSWNTYASDISKLLDSYESNIGCSRMSAAESNSDSTIRNSSEELRVVEKRGFFSRRSSKTSEKLSSPVQQSTIPSKIPQAIIEILTYESLSDPILNVHGLIKQGSSIDSSDMNPKTELERPNNEINVARKKISEAEMYVRSHFVSDLFYNTRLEEDRSLLKDIHSSSFAWSPSIRKLPPLANPSSKVVSFPVAVSPSQLQLSRRVEPLS